MHFKSSKTGDNEIVKIEGREPESAEVDKIALIAPQATINIIRDYEIVTKGKVKLLETISGIIRCANPNCITNTEEPVDSLFYVTSQEPLVVRCYFCERAMDQAEIENQFGPL